MPQITEYTVVDLYTPTLLSGAVGKLFSSSVAGTFITQYTGPFVVDIAVMPEVDAVSITGSLQYSADGSSWSNGVAIEGENVTGSFGTTYSVNSDSLLGNRVRVYLKVTGSWFVTAKLRALKQDTSV